MEIGVSGKTIGGIDGFSNGAIPQEKMQRLLKGTKELTALYNLGLTAGADLNLQEVLQTFSKLSGQLIDTTNFSISIYNSQTDSLDFLLIFNQALQVDPFSVKMSKRNGLTGRVFTSQTPILIRDISETNHTVETDLISPEDPIRSWLGVPIRNPLANTVYGVISVWHYEPNAFDTRYLKLLSAVAAQASVAIRNAHLFEITQRQATEATLIDEIAQTLTSTLNLDKVLIRMMAQIEALLNIEAGVLFLADPATGDLVYQTALGSNLPDISPFKLPRWQGLAGKVTLTGKPVLVAEADSTHLDTVAQKLHVVPRTILGVPLVLHNQAIGVLQVFNKKNGCFTDRDQRLLSMVASYAAIAIQNARLHENVLAERDRVIEVEEGIRRELAGELHDGPIQLISATMMRIDFCKMCLKDNPAMLPKELDSVQELAGKAIHQMRTMLFELRPLILEAQGLAEALVVFIERRQKETIQAALTLNINTHRLDKQLSRLDSQVEAAIFVIVQEAVANALKHAYASQVSVQVEETPNAIYTLVADNGKGFEVEEVMQDYAKRGSLGMLNLYERAELIGAELTVDSALGKGTRITLKVPKAKEERKNKRSATGQLRLPASSPKTNP